MSAGSAQMVVAMMVAMMLPSIAPTLWRYHRALATTRTHAGRWTMLFALGYASVWIMIGVALFALNTVLSPVAPLAAGAVILGAGALQRTRWKAKQLARCRRRSMSEGLAPKNVVAVWQAGCCLGLHCVLSCAAATAILFVAGLMDMRAMAMITTAITAERLTPAGPHVARLTGALALGVGLSMCIRAIAH